MNSLKSSTVTNFYNSKNTLPSANTQAESTFISHSKNLLTVDNYNCRCFENFDNSVYFHNCYYNSFLFFSLTMFIEI